VRDRLEVVEFWVDGVPVPQGSKTLFRGRMVDSNPGLKPWRKTVRTAAEAALAGRDGFDEAVCILLDFYMPRGKTVRRSRPSTRPDLDKMVRAIGDSLTDAGLWADDGLVVTVHAAKYYADDQPGVNVKVKALA
jgi:Holliday junction resolvase RusA-like endonuclease